LIGEKKNKEKIKRYLLLKCKTIKTLLFEQEETNQRGRAKPLHASLKNPIFFPIQSSLHFVLEPPSHTRKEKTLNSFSMATDSTQLHQLSLLLQSKGRDAERKGGGERCREKRRGEMHKKGGDDCFCV